LNYEPERSRNTISNVTKPVASEALVAWMAKQADDDLFISFLTVAEIRRGILEKPAGKKRRELQRWFTGPDGPQSLFAGRVLPFDEKAGLVWARLMADGRAKGRPRNPLDMIIAAVAEANNLLGCHRKRKRLRWPEDRQPLARELMSGSYGQ
jgi:predicted nucleic acid-binding protein